MAPRLGSSNGIHLNGIQVQGMMLNGIVLNRMTINGVRLNGINFQGTTLLGEGLDAVDLQGATLDARADSGELIELTIDAVEPDPVRPDMTYYALSLDGQNVCGDGGRGLFVPGAWDETGARLPTREPVHSFSCTDGVIAKCVLWGYTPWEVGPDAHQACTRLARADYCGDGTAYTRNGTEIDVFDELGVQRPALDGDAMRFEAGWGPAGAVCVDAPRYDMVLPDGGEHLPPCWEELPRCTTEAEAQEHGALLSNRSHGDLRNVCTPPDFRRRRPGRSK